jgi:predicted SAM-dependent methyltransferase
MRRFSKPKPNPAKTGSRLHIGCVESHSGWTNIDSRRLPGVDFVLDVRVSFERAAAIYAEHFLEHLL